MWGILPKKNLEDLEIIVLVRDGFRPFPRPPIKHVLNYDNPMEPNRVLVHELGSLYQYYYVMPPRLIPLLPAP